jgi:hypothetical protein
LAEPGYGSTGTTGFAGTAFVHSRLILGGELETVMKTLVIVTAAVVSAAALGGCASDQYASACERDYANNRTAATVAGAAVGAAAGAAIAKDDAAGALIGGAAGGVIGNQVAKRDDPCGYRTGYRDGYYRDRRDSY